MPAAEFVVWLAFYQQYGFPADRLEWTTANAGAAACQTLGGKVKPKELTAKFGASVTPHRVLMAFFDGLVVKEANGG